MATSVQLSFADVEAVEEPALRTPSPNMGAAGSVSHSADQAALAALQAALVDARASEDDRPPLVVLASCLGQFDGPPVSAPPVASCDSASLRQARDDWLRRLETSRKSKSSLVAYRVAIDDLLDWSEPRRRSVLEEATIVDYLSAYEQRAHPAPATYYRRFLLLRRFLRWVSRRVGVPDPFRDLDPPPKPRQERDWLTREEFRRLLDAAGKPDRNLPGLAERDQLTLLTLVTTGLRRSELCALEWQDLELDGRKKSLLVRHGKGDKSRSQPIPARLARELRRVRDARQPRPTDPVFCGLAGGRLQETILADIIRRAATRAGIEKHVTAHTLRHTAATWLRQERGDTRLVAEYLGHADLSTVARYAHVHRDELFDAAGRLEQLASPEDDPTGSAGAMPGGEARPDQTSASDDGSAHDQSTESHLPHRRRRRRRRRRGR
jgi:integrase/recombinase XerC